MMHLAVVTRGTLFGRIKVHEGQAGLIGRDVLELIGVGDGDELEVHTDGRLLILMPVQPNDGAEEIAP